MEHNTFLVQLEHTLLIQLIAFPVLQVFIQKWPLQNVINVHVDIFLPQILKNVLYVLVELFQDMEHLDALNVKLELLQKKVIVVVLNVIKDIILLQAVINVRNVLKIHMHMKNDLIIVKNAQMGKYHHLAQQSAKNLKNN
jgi:hypothetical protein